MRKKNNKRRIFKYIIIWFFLSFISEIIFWLIVSFLYIKWYILKDKWENKLWVIQIKDNFNNKVDFFSSWTNIKVFGTKKILKTKYISIDKNGSKIKISYSRNIEFNTNILLLSILNDSILDKDFFIKTLRLYIKENNIKKITNINFNNFLLFFNEKLFFADKLKDNKYFNNIKEINNLEKNIYLKYDLIFKKLNTYWYIKKLSKNTEYNKFINYSNFVKDINTRLLWLNNSIKKYNDNNYCFYNFCWYTWNIIWGKYNLKYIYNYIKNAILKDKNMNKYILKYWKEYWISPKVAYSVIIIENTRHNTTYKWIFKNFLVKYKIPEIVIMSKFSYWIFWIKLNAMDKIINWYYLNRKNKYINYILNNFYEINKNYNLWDKDFVNKEWLQCFRSNVNKKTECLYNRRTDKDAELINYIVKHKEVQIMLFFEFMNQQIKNREAHWINIRNKYWILVTLWNIWWYKKPHKDYDTWWAILNIYWKKMYVWDIAKIISNSIELEKMILDIKDILKN